MTYILRFFLATAVPLFMGCSNLNEPGSVDSSVEDPATSMSWVELNFEKNKWRWEQLPESTPKCDVGNGDPFRCVKEACANAEGVYDTDNNACVCDSSQGDVLMFTPRFGGACLPPRPNDESYFSTKLPNLLLTINNKQEVQDSGEKLFSMAEGKQGLNSGAPIFLLEHMFVHETIESRGDMESLLFNIDLDWLKSTMGTYGEVGRKQVFLETDQATPSSHPLLEEAQSLIASRGPYSNFKFSSRDGCRTQCYGEYWEESEDGFIVLRDLFIEGYKVSSKIYFTNSKDISSYYTLMTLDESGDVNLIYERKSENLEAGIFQHKISVFDPSGSPLLTDKVISPSVQISRERKKEVGYPSDVSPSLSMVSVCEWGISPFTFADFWDRVVFGPHVSSKTDFSGSVWGWHENLDREPLVYSKGSYAQFEFGYLPLEEMVQAQVHTANVVRSALEASEMATVTSMDYDSCISSEPEKNPLIRENFPGRVINLSAYSEVTGVACEKKIDVVKSTEGKLLWVLAAGNDGGLACEQGMRHLPNVITVTAINPNAPTRIEAGVQRGKDITDTASFRSLKFGAGSSFAAPVVAALAAEIFSKYPSLTPKEVKKALLLGVDFSGLDVASGGRTVAQKAMEVAGILNDDSYASFDRILSSLYGVSATDSLRNLTREENKTRRQIKKAKLQIRELSQKLEGIEYCENKMRKDDSRSSEDSTARGRQRHQSCDQTEDQLSQQKKEIGSLIQATEASLADLEIETEALSKKIMNRKKMESHLEWLSEREIER